MSTRNAVEVTGSVVVKTFSEPSMFDAEARALLIAPWAAPRVVDVTKRRIVLELLTPALELPKWRAVKELRALLAKLHAAGLNHRDVHVGNIVRCEERGPLLIDWEWATTEIGPLSYDLHGPGPQTTPHPEGKRGISMWIGARHRLSVSKRWGR